jgi:hypothetical protein
VLNHLWRWLRGRPRSAARPNRSARLSLESLEERAVPAFVNPPNIITGPDTGLAPQVRVFNSLTGTQQISFVPAPTQFSTGVRVAVGDVDGDGVPDIITAAGPGRPPTVNVYSGQSLALLVSFLAFSSRNRAGVYVAVGNFDSDASLEIIAGAGNVPRVRIFNIAGNSAVQIPGPLGNILVSRTKANPGVRVAAGDVDGQPGDELIAALGKGTSPRVNVYNTNGALITTFFAYGTSFTGGVYVAAGDVNNDGRDEIIAGPGSGVSTIRVFNGTGGQVLTFQAFESTFLGGARVAVTDGNGDGLADIVVGRGPGASPEVIVVDGRSLAQLNSFFAFDQSFTGGVFVAGT